MNANSITIQRLFRGTLIALALGTTLPAFSATIANLPPEHKQGDMTFVSGGVGEDEAAAMKQAASRYPLELEFVFKEKSGHEDYLAGDRVVIRDHAGKTVLDTTAEGPFLLVKLPAGPYTVTAWRHDVAKEHAVTVAAGKHERVVFEW